LDRATSYLQAHRRVIVLFAALLAFLGPIFLPSHAIGLIGVELTPKRVQRQNITQHVTQQSESIIDTLEWWSGSTYYCYNEWLRPHDTLIVLYQALGPCSLISVEARWGLGGTAELHIWERDTLTGAPGADLLPCRSYRLEVQGWRWEQVDLSPDSLCVDLDYDYLVTHYGWFIVGYIVGGTNDTARPQICYDQPQHEYPPHSLWSCPECPEPGWNGLHAGNLWVEWLNRVIIKYYAGSTPPAVSSVSQLPDTYVNSGPFRVIAEAYDLDGTVVDAWLFYTVKGSGSIDSTNMIITPVKGKVNLYGEILGDYSVGDTVGYQVKAIDNDGKEGLSEIKSFTICEPQNPAAEILIVNDGGDDREWFYKMILSDSAINKESEVWKVADHKGIDSSVINYGWPTIIWFGYEVSYIPAKDYNDSPIISFLKNGNSLFLTSPDYFYHNNIPSDVWTDFVPGDFAYDYLGVASCMSDPGLTTGESLGDTTFIGVSGDPITNDWVDRVLVINNANLGLQNWADYVRAKGSAADIFWGVESGARCGVRYDGGNFKTVFIPWIYEAIVNYDDAVTLMRNILRWFGRIKGVEEATVSNLTYRLYQNSPNPFSNTTRICYEIPIKSTVSLKIFDITGRLLKTFNFIDQRPGKHTYSLDASELVPGLYFYSIEAGNFGAVQKMLIIK